jgi:hypothetical protein
VGDGFVVYGSQGITDNLLLTEAFISDDRGHTEHDGYTKQSSASASDRVQTGDFIRLGDVKLSSIWWWFIDKDKSDSRLFCDRRFADQDAFPTGCMAVGEQVGANVTQLCSKTRLFLQAEVVEYVDDVQIVRITNSLPNWIRGIASSPFPRDGKSH